MPQKLRIATWSFLLVLAGGLAWYVVSQQSAHPLSPEPIVERSHPERSVVPSTQRSYPQSSAHSYLWSLADSKSARTKFSELRSRAEAGDAVAQRDLAELYQRCSSFSISPSNMYAMLDAYARIRGVAESSYDDVKKRFSTACSALDGGEVIPEEAYTGWFQRAAHQGDAYSKVALASKSWSDLKDEEYKDLARDVVNSADPEAIFALGDLLALAPESSDLSEFKSISTGPYANYAWGIAACRMGADCDPGSYRTDSLCVNTGMCGNGNFEETIRTHAVPAGQQDSLDKAIREVLKVVDKKP